MRQTILVIDDEPFVLNALGGILRHAGYRALLAATPSEALEFARQNEDPIHLFLSDVVLPQMSGPSLAVCLEELHPQASTLFMAGMPDHPEVIERILTRGRAFLPKPFTAATLLRRVEQALSGSSAELVA